MGTQPENIERALQGKRTLPRPGEPKELPGGTELREPAEEKVSSAGPEADPEADTGGVMRGKGKRMLSEDEERRHQLRGGTWNNASSRDRV